MGDRTSIVHIGFHKTGSSSLQRRLRRSRHLLARQGFCYPVDHLPSPDQHSHLALYLKSGSASDYQRAWSSISADYRHSGCRHLILSGEEFSTLRQPLVEHFAADLLALTQPVRIILYIRNLHRFIVSVMAQFSKAGDFVAHPQTTIDRMRGFNPTARLTSWEEVCGAANVTVQCLDQLPAGYGIEEHFADFAGVKLKPMEFAVAANRSIDPIASGLLSQLAYEFGTSPKKFYTAYFRVQKDRMVLPKTEQHLADLAETWVAGVDLSHPKLAPFRDSLRQRPAAAPAGDDPAGRGNAYLQALATVLWETAGRPGQPRRPGGRGDEEN